MTNTSGIATFSYAGTNPGTDTVTALVRSTATANVNGHATSVDGLDTDAAITTGHARLYWCTIE